MAVVFFFLKFTIDRIHSKDHVPNGTFPELEVGLYMRSRPGRTRWAHSGLTMLLSHILVMQARLWLSLAIRFIHGWSLTDHWSAINHHQFETLGFLCDGNWLSYSGQSFSMLGFLLTTHVSFGCDGPSQLGLESEHAGWSVHVWPVLAQKVASCPGCDLPWFWVHLLRWERSSLMHFCTWAVHRIWKA